MRLLLAALALLAAPALAQPASGGPSGHRLFLAPTARPVPAGEGRVGLTQLAIPTAAVGVGGGVSLGAGVVAVPAPSLAGVLFAESKWTVWDRPGLALAVGVTGRANPFQNGAVHAVPYAVATAGRGAVAGTVGVGGRVNVERPTNFWPYRVDWTPALCCGDVWAEDPGRTASVVPAPAAFAGFEVRASSRWTWIAEATALPDQTLGYGWGYGSPEEDRRGLARGPVHYDVTVGTGARVQTGRAAVDFGLVVGRDADGQGPPVAGIAPWLSVTVGLGG